MRYGSQALVKVLLVVVRHGIEVDISYHPLISHCSSQPSRKVRVIVGRRAGRIMDFMYIFRCNRVVQPCYAMALRNRFIDEDWFILHRVVIVLVGMRMDIGFAMLRITAQDVVVLSLVSRAQRDD